MTLWTTRAHDTFQVLKVDKNPGLPDISDGETERKEAEETASPSVYSVVSAAIQGPSFVETAWQEVRKVPYASESRDKRRMADLMLMHERGLADGVDMGMLMGVNLAGFEAWWRMKVGIDDADIPVRTNHPCVENG